MQNGQSILNYIIHQHTKGYTGFNIEPLSLSVEKIEVQVVRPVILPVLHDLAGKDYKEVNTSLDLGNDLLVLTQNDIDLPLTAVLTLESQSNLFAVTRAEYIAMNYNKHQVFDSYLKVSVRNYGGFIPFQLEFLKVTPILLA